MEEQEDNTGKIAGGEAEMRGRMAEREEKERWVKIFASKYNEKYVEIITGSTPTYLEKSLSKQEVRTIARFRLGNEERNNRYWEENEKKEM